MADLQDLVDDLAIALSGPVGVDDRRLHSVAYSAHVDGIDRVRLASILQREPPRDVAAWLHEVAIERAEGFARLPPNPELGMAARVCIPLRFDDRLLGFLWLIDEPETLTEAALQRALASSHDVALALFRLTADRDSDRQEERRLLRTALGLTGEDSGAAVRALLATGRLASTPQHGVLAVGLTDGTSSDDLAQAQIAAAVEHDRRFAGAGEFLVLVHDDWVFALMGVDDGQDAQARAGRVAERVRRSVHSGTHAPPALPGPPVIGLSAVGRRLDDLPAARREAQLAAAVGPRLPRAPAVASWDQLGAFRILAQIVGALEPAALIPDSFRALMTHADAPSLIPTLAAFLDAGADARDAAERLFVHRSSLYHRLRRIERICGLDLGDGDARLELHLALQFWRLAGEPAPSELPPTPVGAVADEVRRTASRRTVELP